MKNIKCLFLLLVIVLFTGCTVNYNLNIDTDLSVTEKVEATEKESTVRTNTGVNSDKAVNYLYDIYKRDDIDPSLSSKVEDGVLTATASASHDSIDIYVNNFESDLFKKAKLSKSGKIYTLTFKQSEMLSSKGSTTLIYDRVNVNISLPFKVIEHNADKRHKNTYTWELTKDQELRDIKITFDTSVHDNSKELSIGIFDIKIKYSVLALTIILLIITIIISVVYVNNKKNNKI